MPAASFAVKPWFPEALLHYVWLSQRFDAHNLATACGKPITVLHPGRHNRNAGPDFSSASLRIGTAELAGPVELHLHTSHWRQHGHSADPAYADVGLHVVWEHDDADVCLPGGTTIPTLELKGRIAPVVLRNYAVLAAQLSPAPPCIPLLVDAQAIALQAVAATEAALVERLHAKAQEVLALVEACNGDWEEAAYRRLAYCLGQPLNAEAFLNVAAAVPSRTLRRLRGQGLAVEAVLLGLAGFPTAPVTDAGEEDSYLAALRKEYAYQAGKLGLPAAGLGLRWQMGKMRPAMLPPLRLAQLAALLEHGPPLLETYKEAHTLRELAASLAFPASAYWARRYSFTASEATTGAPILGAATLQTLVANALVPTLIAYGMYRQAPEWQARALAWLERLPAERNYITRYFEQAGLPNKTAAQSQGLIGLYKNHCTPRRCLECQIGAVLLGREVLVNNEW